MTALDWVTVLAWATVAWAAAGALSLGAAQALGLALPESVVEKGAVLHSLAVVTLAAGLAAAWRAAGDAHLAGPTLAAAHGAAWQLVLTVDGKAVAFLGLIALVYPAIVRFSVPSFHREPGAQRFWFLVSLFAFGLVTVTLAGNIDVFLLGWEVVGVTSVMLIAYFRRNLRSAKNSLRALVFYRLCDLGVLGAAVWMHHAFPSSDFAHLVDDAAIPTSGLVAAALLFGSLAKAAQLPMSSWLHRAMEGPASSSAIFYGALSVHLGPYLLLRTAPLWLPHEGVRLAMGLIGASTALYAGVVGSTRPDAKTALAYATMAQLGVLFVELALGWHTLAMVHLWAHAGLRTWQFLRSSSLIQDFQENPMVSADVLRRRGVDWSRWLPTRAREWLYLAAQRQFWLDGMGERLVGRPVLAVFSWLSLLEGPLTPPREAPPAPRASNEAEAEWSP